MSAIGSGASAGLLFLGLLLFLEGGRRLGARKEAAAEGAGGPFGAVEGAIFGLLGLMIAFTFSGAAARLDTRRAQIVQETNAIGTAYLRLDLLPPPARDALRAQFREYVASRLATYRKLPDVAAARAELDRSRGLQDRIWTEAVEAARKEPTSTAVLLLPALNEMFDITTTRLAAMQMHPPAIVFAMLGVLALVSALLAGYGMARVGSRPFLHPIAFAAILAATVYVIIDMEYPRAGLIQVRDFDRLLEEIHEGMR